MKKISNNIVEAVEYYNNHKEESITSISKSFNIGRHTLSKYIKEDIEKFKYYYNNDWYFLDDKEEEAIDYYINNPNVSFAEIQKKFGYKSTLFKNKLQIKGLDSERRYSVNFNRQLFKTIETEEDAYWLGFILADGYLNEERNFLAIKLGAKDKHHLEKFCKYAQCSIDNIKETKGAVDNLLYVVTLNSKDVVLNLKQYGIFQRKSGKEIPYYNINKNLKNAYIRGIIDGDGWILQSLKGFGLVGSYEVCKYFVDDMELNPEHIHDHGIIKKIDVRNQSDAKKFANKYYANATIYLDRKMELAKKLM